MKNPHADFIHRPDQHVAQMLALDAVDEPTAVMAALLLGHDLNFGAAIPVNSIDIGYIDLH